MQTLLAVHSTPLRRHNVEQRVAMCAVDVGRTISDNKSNSSPAFLYVIAAECFKNPYNVIKYTVVVTHAYEEQSTHVK